MTNSIAFMLGQFVGGFLLIYILSAIIEKLAAQRIFDDPVKGKMTSVFSGWLLASLIAGFGMADGGPYYWFALVIYAIPAIAVGLLFHHRGVALRDEVGSD